MTRGYEDPPSELFRYNGEPAIGLAVGMRKGANILDFGEELDARDGAGRGELPIGIERASGRRPARRWWTKPSAISSARWSRRW